ncbi:MAG: hypothetical protein JO117_08855 [Verrucomicrobia bacterium]|nr:hypothetical protein [Verrucomicrobiota bacterium]
MSLLPKISFPRTGFFWFRPLTVCALGGAFLVLGLLTPATTPRTLAAAPAINADALDALIGQLKQQQDQQIANQTKIETQLAALKEELRQLKIYTSRAGSGGRR